MTRQSYERRPGPDSHDVDIVNAERAVNIQKALAEGSSPLGDSGIEIETVQALSPHLSEAERFMAEPIEVHLHDPATEDEPIFAEVTVNGVYRMVRRGETAIIPRSHLAVLAQAKQERLVQTRITNPDGSMGYQEKMVLRLTYPFSVIHDGNPKGAAWIRQLLKNPG